MRKSHLILLFSIIILFFAGWAALLLLPKPEGPKVLLSRVGFEALEGWQEDNQGEALAAFQKSCQSFLKQPERGSVSPRRVGGIIKDWLLACELALAVEAENDIAARKFFEDNFTPLQITTQDGPKGLLTGYYEPIMAGSYQETSDNKVPLYARPKELITVNLGLFRSDLKGRRVAGKVTGGQLRPFSSREEIEEGALEGRGLELIWLRDPVDAFFLHIQGSGRVRLSDGSMQMVGYAGPNGHPYTSLGRVMIKRGLISSKDLSMQGIRAWLQDNPDQAQDLMWENASYIFFRFLKGDGPIGSQGVELTGGRSLAVDRGELPLGAPLWLSGTRPSLEDPEGIQVPFERLMVTQDTGGAIIGTLRGDVFWGLGEEAELLAGHMANFSEFYILLPLALASRILGEGEGDET